MRRGERGNADKLLLEGLGARKKLVRVVHGGGGNGRGAEMQRCRDVEACSHDDCRSDSESARDWHQNRR